MLKMIEINTLQDAQLPGTPRGLYNAEAAKLKPLMDAVHGNAYAVTALVVAASRQVA